MAQPIVLAVDAMSGDHGLSVTVPAALSCLERHKRLRVILVGDLVRLRAALLNTTWQPGRRLSLQHASQVVAMDDVPARALRNKKDSSMRVAVELVQSGRAHAAVSAGNTGALMAIARF
jgi:glycerol-3-phosphate acyltransferase PlsX